MCILFGESLCVSHTFSEFTLSTFWFSVVTKWNVHTLFMFMSDVRNFLPKCNKRHIVVHPLVFCICKQHSPAMLNHNTLPLNSAVNNNNNDEKMHTNANHIYEERQRELHTQTATKWMWREGKKKTEIVERNTINSWYYNWYNTPVFSWFVCMDYLLCATSKQTPNRQFDRQLLASWFCSLNS